MHFHRPRPLVTCPSVSVVIPCYNYGRYLAAAVASALDQSDVDVDVLIVDDASHDDSADLARRLADADDRVDVVVHKRNHGAIRTFNDGLSRVRGDYVVLLSADDLLTPDSLTRATALMEHHRGVGLVYGFARSFVGDPPPGLQSVRNWSYYPGHQWVRLAAGRGRCFLSSPEAVMRRAALEEVGLYDEAFPHTSDFDMWLRTALRWDVGRVNGATQALYRVHDANMHLTTYGGWLTDLDQRRRTFQVFFARHAAGLPDAEALQRLAMVSLAGEALRRARTARRDGHSDDVAAYLAFAEDTAPSVPAPGHRVAPAAVDRFAERVGHHLRWRYERRYGT